MAPPGAAGFAAGERARIAALHRAQHGGELTAAAVERRCRRSGGLWGPPGTEPWQRVTRPWPAILDALGGDADAPRIAVIEGDAGMGKSVLLLQTVDAIAARGGLATHATAAELAAALATHGPRDAVRGLAARRLGLEPAALPEHGWWLALDDLDVLVGAGRARVLDALVGAGVRLMLAQRPGAAVWRGATSWQLLPFEPAQRRSLLDRAGAVALRRQAALDPPLEVMLDVPVHCAAACAHPGALTRRALIRVGLERGRSARALDEYREAMALAPGILAGAPEAEARFAAAVGGDAPVTGLPWMLVAEGVAPAAVIAAIGHVRARTAATRPPGPDRAALTLAVEVWLEAAGRPRPVVAALLDEVALALERAQRRRRDGSWIELEDPALAAAALALAARAGLSDAAPGVLDALRGLRTGRRAHEVAHRARRPLAAGLVDPSPLVRWAALWVATVTARRGVATGAGEHARRLATDPASAVQSLACRAMVALAHPDGAPLALAALAGHRDRQVQAGAAFAVGALATAEAGAALLTAADRLGDRGGDDPVPAAVLGALETWADQLARDHAPPPPADRAALAARFAAALERNLPWVGALAASGLGKVGEPRHVPALLALLAAPSDPRVESSALFAVERLLLRFAREPALRPAIAALVGRLGTRHAPAVRRLAAGGLLHAAAAGVLADDALHALAEHVADRDDQVAGRAILALDATPAGRILLAAAAAADPVIDEARRRLCAAPGHAKPEP